MNKCISRSLFIALVSSLLPLLHFTKVPAQVEQPQWLVAEIGIIGTSSEEILSSALDKATTNQYAGLIIKLDTPGGSLESTHRMVKDIMSAECPVVVWVGPDGSRAASAGAFITLAAHIAAMAPGTNIGAAHPIEVGGKDIEGEAGKKIENDTIAFMESIARSRNRNVDLAISFVKASTSITANEALENKVIDYVEKDISALLNQIHDKPVILANNEKKLINSKDAIVLEYELSLRQKFLTILSNPNLFYLLFLAGLIGLGFELTHPGTIFPGVVGGICMILALIATTVLPVNFGALLLVLAGVAFMIAEIFVPSFGILGIGGFIAFIAGSILLVDPQNEQGLKISLFTIVPGALTLGTAFLFIAYLVYRSGRSKVQAGSEAMVRATGEVIQDFKNGTGQVKIAGEIWRAKTNDSIDLKRGEKIVVTDLEGLVVSVSKKNN